MVLLCSFTNVSLENDPSPPHLNFKRKTQKDIENPRSGDKTPGLAPLAISFWKYQKR